MEHGGNIWLAARKYGLKPEQIIDFSANINPLGPSPRAMVALGQALGLVRHYPEPQAESLRSAICEKTALEEASIILGNGAAELIYALGKKLQPRRVLIPVPTFSEYACSFKDFEQVQIALCREKNFSPDPKELASLLQPGDLLVLCNPNNPTGQLVTKDQMLYLLKKAAEAGAYLLVDEAFMDFVQPEQTLLPEVPHNSVLFVLRSLTKFFAMPGLRLGYLAGPPEIIKSLYNILPPWRVNLMAQVAGLASIEDSAYIEETISLIKVQKRELIKGLSAIAGLKPLPPAANFILVNCRESGFTAGELAGYLGPRGILIRNCGNFTGLDQYFFRLAVRKEEENQVLLSALRELIDQYK